MRIELKDDGPGISADDLERIFSPFFTTKPQGTGLGLYIVHSIVKRHGGTVYAESAGEGRGSSFTIELPRLLG